MRPLKLHARHGAETIPEFGLEPGQSKLLLLPPIASPFDAVSVVAPVTQRETLNISDSKLVDQPGSNWALGFGYPSRPGTE